MLKMDPAKLLSSWPWIWHFLLPAVQLTVRQRVYPSLGGSVSRGSAPQGTSFWITGSWLPCWWGPLTLITKSWSDPPPGRTRTGSCRCLHPVCPTVPFWIWSLVSSRRSWIMGLSSYTASREFFFLHKCSLVIMKY